MGNKILSEYIDTVCSFIHYKKLRLRIREELSDHINEMYNEVIENTNDSQQAAEVILTQLGDPFSLGNELKITHKKVLAIARFTKILAAVLIICCIPMFIYGVGLVFDEVISYATAYDIEQVEQNIINDYARNESIKLLTEIEVDGILHKFYVNEKPESDVSFCFKVSSIKLFGFSIYDKFTEYATIPFDEYNYYHLDLEPNTDNYLLILTGETEAKYQKRYYEPIDSRSNLEPYWSDFVTIPQNATYEQPIVILDRAPEGYKWSIFEEYDDNKNLIERRIY